MTTTNDTKDDEDEEDNEEEEEEEDARQSIPELQRLLLEYSAQMSELDATFGPEDGPEKAEMKKELEDLVELTREVLEERQKEEEEEEEEDHHHHHKNDDDDDTIENELEDLENLRQIEEEENAKRKREEEEKRWKVLKRPGGDDDDDTNTRTTTRTDNGCTHNKSNTTDIRNPQGDEGEGKHHRGRRDAPTPQNLLYRGADDKPKYDDEGNLIVPKKFQIQEDDDKVTRDRKRKQLQTFKYKQKQKAVVSEHAKRASDWNDFKTKKASKKKRLDNMSSGVFKKKSMFSGVGDGEKNVSKLTVPKKHQFHSM